MRASALALILLLFLVPSLAAAAPVTHEHTYVVWGSGCAGGGALVRNCETYFPPYGATNVTVEVADVSGQSTRIRLCHEWTYDDGSHPTVWCRTACSPSLTDALSFPGPRTAYRVIVDVRGAGCAATATAGTLRTVFS